MRVYNKFKQIMRVIRRDAMGSTQPLCILKGASLAPTSFSSREGE